MTPWASLIAGILKDRDQLEQKYITTFKTEFQNRFNKKWQVPEEYCFRVLIDRTHMRMFCLHCRPKTFLAKKRRQPSFLAKHSDDLRLAPLLLRLLPLEPSDPVRVQAHLRLQRLELPEQRRFAP